MSWIITEQLRKPEGFVKLEVGGFMLELIKDYFSQDQVTELAMSYKAQKVWEQLPQKNLSASDIFQVQQAHGYDVACAILYKTLRENPQFSEMIQFVDLHKNVYSKSHQNILAVVLVHNPWDSQKNNKEYQWQLKNMAADMGLDCAIPEIQYRRSVYPNAFAYQELLKRWSGRDVIFITHSQASLELRWVLEKSQQLNVNVRGWLNVSGLLFGTSRPPANKDFFYKIKNYFNNEYPILPEVARSNAQCYSPLKFKETFPMIHLLGLRPKRYYYFLEKLNEPELNHWGPHDGLITLADYLQKPGVVWPIWGQGHTIDVNVFRRRIQAGLQWMISQTEKKRFIEPRLQEIATEIE